MGGRSTANRIDFGPGPPATEKSTRPLPGPLRAVNRHVQSGSDSGEPAAKGVELDTLGLHQVRRVVGVEAAEQEAYERLGRQLQRCCRRGTPRRSQPGIG